MEQGYTTEQGYTGQLANLFISLNNGEMTSIHVHILHQHIK